MNWKLILVGLVTLSLLAVVSYYFRNNISTFVRQGFQNPTTGSAKREFVLYHAKWCPHCKDVIPEFEKMAPNKSVVVGGKTVEVNMYEQTDNADKHKGKNIKGFPTIHFYDANGSMSEYEGPRKAEAFLEYLNTKLGGGV
jgi:protein disulfide-isomerase A6